ncbi:hypothetical protein A2U01_0034892, partial [Trifolium medium]|nr:hypothetical protein [Trifolium medium]
MGGNRDFSDNRDCDDLCFDLRFPSLDRFIGEIVDRSLGNVSLGGGFSSELLPSSSNGDLVDPFLDPWIWSRKRSFEMWLQRPLSIRE